MKPVLAYASLACLLGSVSAHTIFQEVHVNGVSQGHLNGLRLPSYNGPIEDVSSTNIICNGGPNPLTHISPNIIRVAAGAQVTAEWHHNLQGYTGTGDDPVGTSHKGPILTYLAKVNSATQTTVTGLRWFKIHHEGYDAATNTWAVDRMIANRGKVTFTIPSCIAPGQYLMRHELIALHAAGNYPGAQFYMECAQLEITGGGSANPATVSFPGAYSGSDPGIKINIYYPPITNYVIPGPAVFTCGGSQPTTTGQQPTTTVMPTTTTTTSSTPTSTVGLVPLYGQCGGIGWTGGTVCAPPGVCRVSNPYYSQCLP